MARDLVTRLSVDAKQYVREFQRAERTAGQFGARTAASANRGLTAVERSAGRQGRAYDDVGRRADRSGRLVARSTDRSVGAMGRLARSAVSLGAAGAGFGLVTMLKSAVSFQQQMSKVQAVSGATTAQFKAMQEQAITLGQKTSFSASQAAGAMTELAQAGFTANQTMKILPGTLSLAAASGTDLAQAAELQASTLRAFGLAAGDATKVADVLAATSNKSAATMVDLQDSMKFVAPVAKLTGQSFEDMAAAIGLMANSGIKGELAGTTLRNALLRLTDPTTKAREALKTLGLSASELRGPNGLLPLPQILDKIIKGSAGVSKSQRNAALSAIFGARAISGLSVMVDKGSGALEKQSKALQNTRGQAQKTALIMRNNVAGAWDNFTGSIESSAIALTSKGLPGLRKFLNGASNAVTRFTKDTQGPGGLNKAITNLTDTLVTQFNKAAPKVLAAAVKLGFIVTKGLIKGFLEGPPLTRAIVAAVILRKLGGAGLLRTAGRSAGAQVSAGMAEGMAAGELAGGGRGGSPIPVGRGGRPVVSQIARDAERGTLGRGVVGPRSGAPLSQLGGQSRFAAAFPRGAALAASAAAFAGGWAPAAAVYAAAVFGPEFVKALGKDRAGANPKGTEIGAGLPKKSGILGGLLGPGISDAFIKADESKIEKYGRTVLETSKRLKAAGDQKGLQKLAAQAREFARESPKNRAMFLQTARGIDALTKSVAQAGVTSRLNKTKAEFKSFGVSITGVFNRQRAESVKGWFDVMAKGADGSLKGMSTAVKINLGEIKTTFARDPRAMRQAMQANLNAAMDGLAKDMARGSVDAKKGFAQIRRYAARDTGATRDTVLKNYPAMARAISVAMDKGVVSSRTGTREILRLARTNTGGARDTVQKNFRAIANSISNQVDKGVISTDRGMAAINSMVRRSLTAYGVQTNRMPPALNRAQIRTGAGGRVPNAAKGGRVGREVGGWIGERGQREGDVRQINVGGGEAVVNYHQQPEIERAMGFAKAMGVSRYGNLDELFSNETRPHYAFAKGGKVPKRGYAGGGFVPSSGTNFSQGDEPKIAAALNALGKAIGKTIYGISGYRSPSYSVSVGGFANDPHTKGIAADIGVGDQSRASAGQLSAAILRRFGLYRPFGGPQEINHLQLLGGGKKFPGAPGAGVAGAGLGVAFKPLKRVKVKRDAGVFSDVAQAAVDKVRKQANAFTKKEYEKVAAAAAVSSVGTGATSQSQIGIAKIIAQVGKRLGAGPKAMLAAFEAALVESNMSNISGGDRDSVGVFQQRPSQGWGSVGQIMNVTYAAGKFFESAIPKSRGWGGSAGSLAQAVQRSAYPDRYDQRAGQAQSIMRRAGLARGGRVGRAKGGYATGKYKGPWTLTGKAGWYGGPRDSGDNNRPALAGATNREPAIATYNRGRLGGWWAVMAPNRRFGALRRTDTGPAPGTGRKFDINYSAVPLFGYSESRFPTDQGQWKGRYFGLDGRKKAQALVGMAGKPTAAAAALYSDATLKAFRTPLVPDAFNVGYNVGLGGGKLRGTDAVSNLMQSLFEDAGGATASPSTPDKPSKVQGLGAYTFPLPQFGSAGRVDRGQDMEASRGNATTVALGRGRIVGTTMGFPGMQLKLGDGPLKGKTVFYGHNARIRARSGSVVKKGQALGATGGAPFAGRTHTEIGFMDGFNDQRGSWSGTGSRGGQLMHALLHAMAPGKIPTRLSGARSGFKLPFNPKTGAKVKGHARGGFVGRTFAKGGHTSRHAKSTKHAVKTKGPSSIVVQAPMGIDQGIQTGAIDPAGIVTSGDPFKPMQVVYAPGSVPGGQAPSGIDQGLQTGAITPAQAAPFFAGVGGKAKSGSKFGAKLDGYLKTFLSSTDQVLVENAAGKVQELLGNTARFTERVLDKRYGLVLKQIRGLEKGGVTKEEAAQIKRLQGALTLISEEVGRRVGLSVKAINESVAGIEAKQTAVSRGFRRLGIDEGSIKGLTGQLQYTSTDDATYARAIFKLTGAKARANRYGDKETAAALAEQIAQLTDQRDEEQVTRIETFRAIGQAQKDQAQARKDFQAAAYTKIVETQVNWKAAVADAIGGNAQRVSDIVADIDLRRRAGVITDQGAADYTRNVRQQAIFGRFGPITDQARLELMADLKDAVDSNTASTDAQTQALLAVQKEISAQNAHAAAISSTSLGAAWKAMGAVINGEIVGKVIPSGRSAGDGSVTTW